MQGATILIVEDEAVVAEDIRQGLEAGGYHVPLIAVTGEDAVKGADRVRPDLVLMDIRLQNGSDGIAAAMEIYRRFEIPVIYLTAYADEQTLRRARGTHPFGYLIKPFSEKQIRTHIEIALDRHRIERSLKESERCFAKALECSGLAVIATDREGIIVSMNPEAEYLTGWKRVEAVGLDIGEVFDSESVASLIRETPRMLNGGPPDPIREAAMLSPAQDYETLVSRSGERIAINLDAAVLRDKDAKISGIVITFKQLDDDL